MATAMSTGPHADVIEKAWARALEVPRVELHDNFFTLGGDSFTAMRLLAMVEEETGVAVTFSDLLEAPVLGEFIERVSEATGRSAGRAVRRDPRTAPLTPVQLQQWRNRRTGATGAEVFWLYEIEGNLDVEALRRAFDELARRHDILRTTVRRRWGRVRQVVGDPPPDLLRVVESTDDLPKRQRTPAGVVQKIFEEDYGAFDYERGPLVKATLVALGHRRYVLSVAASEMAVDGSSRRVFATALSTLYKLLVETGSADAYPRPPWQFGDFAAELRSRVPRKVQLDQLAYWRTKLEEIEPGMAVQGRDLSPEISWSGPIPDRTCDLPPSFMAAVRGAARGMSVTAFNVLATGFAIVLRAATEAGSPAFTTTVSHRDLRGAEHLIGTFFNIVLVSVPFEGAATAEDLVRVTAGATREAFVHRDVSLSQALRLRKRKLPDARLLDVTHVRFQLHEDPGDIQLVGTRMRRIPPPFKPTHELYLAATSTADDGLSLYFSCRPDLPSQIVHNFTGTFRRVVEAISRDPQTPVADLVDMAARALVRR